MHVVVNHLRLRDPVPEATLEALQSGVNLVVEAGGSSGRVGRSTTGI